MAYPAKLLATGEEIQYELRPHWRALIMPAIWLIIVVFAGSWLFFITDITWLRWVIAGVIAFLLIWRVLIAFLRWITTEYVFTNRRVIVRSGLITRKGKDMPLSKVVNVSFEVPGLGRILNYGRLIIQTAGDDSDLIVDDVPNVEAIQRDVYELYEKDDLRRRQSGPGVTSD